MNYFNDSATNLKKVFISGCGPTVGRAIVVNIAQLVSYSQGCLIYHCAIYKKTVNTERKFSMEFSMEILVGQKKDFLIDVSFVDEEIFFLKFLHAEF